MSPSAFVFRELLSAVRGKSLVLLLGMIVLLFLFLAAFSSFFVLGTTDAAQERTAPGVIVCYLSPRLSADQLQGLYRGILARADVAAVTYAFASELSPGRIGGAFLVRPVDPARTDAVVAALRGLAGVTEVDAPKRASSGAVHLSVPMRIGLLVVLIVTGLFSLVVARLAFAELLHNFAAEIKLLRISGTPDRAVQGPLVWLGVGAGGMAGLFLVIALYALHASALSGAVPAGAVGLADPGRVLTAALLSLLIGLVMGGLCGGFGAGLLARFSDYS